MSKIPLILKKAKPNHPTRIIRRTSTPLYCVCLPQLRCCDFAIPAMTSCVFERFYLLE
jgi:hypothetical protein